MTIQHSMRVTTALAATAGLLALSAACSEDSDGEGGNGEEPGENAEGTPAESIPVATDFFEEQAEWSAPVPSEATITVLGDHVLYYYPLAGTIGAYDSSGAEAWTADIEQFADMTEEGEIDATFRIVDDQTVAIVQQGSTEDAGLEAGSSVYRIWLYDVAGGLKGEPVDVPRDEYGLLVLQDQGLAFATLDDNTELGLSLTEPWATVSSTGELTEEQPVSETFAGTPTFRSPTMMLNDHAVGLVQGEYEEYYSRPTEGEYYKGFGGDGWNSIDAAPASAPAGGANAGLLAAAGEQYVVGAWYDTDGDETKTVYGLVDVTTGELAADLACDGGSDGAYFEGDGGSFTASVDGRYYIGRQTLFDAETGDAHCIDSERAVYLQAVDSQGRAYGDIDAGDQNAEVVRLTVDGENTSQQSGGEYRAPIGFLEGDLAIHYDEEAGIITANAVKP